MRMRTFAAAGASLDENPSNAAAFHRLLAKLSPSTAADTASPVLPLPLLLPPPRTKSRARARERKTRMTQCVSGQSWLSTSTKGRQAQGQPGGAPQKGGSEEPPRGWEDYSGEEALAHSLLAWLAAQGAEGVGASEPACLGGWEMRPVSFFSATGFGHQWLEPYLPACLLQDPGETVKL